MLDDKPEPKSEFVMFSTQTELFWGFYLWWEACSYVLVFHTDWVDDFTKSGKPIAWFCTSIQIPQILAWIFERVQLKGTAESQSIL